MTFLKRKFYSRLLNRRSPPLYLWPACARGCLLVWGQWIHLLFYRCVNKALFSSRPPHYPRDQPFVESQSGAEESTAGWRVCDVGVYTRTQGVNSDHLTSLSLSFFICKVGMVSLRLETKPGTWQTLSKLSYCSWSPREHHWVPGCCFSWLHSGSYVYQSQNSRVLSKDNPLKSEYGATQQEPGQSTEREMKSNKKRTRETAQKIKMLERMPAGEMVNTLSHIWGQDNHTIGIHYLVLGKCRTKYSKAPGGQGKA